MNEPVIWHEANLVTILDNQEIEVIVDGALVIQEGKIIWLGKAKDISKDNYPKAKWQSAKGALITPGLIDCHTHLVYGKNRANEWERRLRGESNEGGGIISTVESTRELTEEALFKSALARAKAMLEGGVTTIEIKSGYGLDVKTEKKILRIARMIGRELSIEVQTTFLGAHTLPKEFSDKAKYIQYLAEKVLPDLVSENLVDAVDAFCDPIAFNTKELEILFKKATDLNLPVKIHSDQHGRSGGVKLVEKYKGLSSDHLEYITEEEIKILSKSDTVAVLLPGAQYFLNQEKSPPVSLLRQYGVNMAIATDCNPGTSPTTSLLLMMNMACVKMGLTPNEAFKGVTLNAAKALGKASIKGNLQVGMQADFVLWDISDLIELSYYFGCNPCIKVIKSGKIVYEKRHSF